MRKPIVRAFTVGLVVVFVYYAFQIVQGMFLTLNYVPDVLKAYDSVDDLQHKVSFGIVASPVWIVFEVLGLMALGMVVYYLGRLLRRKL